ncbi:DUF2589 domain-containing protein [Marinomonas sp. TW1]|uniref:DUF2589 domain-containing protein n=1 Tax=Marinomonas sp. TW1 TaxID=1561203 RepID=UPI0007AFAA1E|nr:DUF2589 domain-containing protein [Marinomonas sp. TW1]KZN15466.1 hypothetical protein OA79_01535 [Marinomonas sp. TW1]
MATKSIANQFSGLPMKALIGAPLKAATDANAMIAQSQTQFIISNCFEKTSEESDDLRPVMIKFQLERQVLTSQGTPRANPIKMDFAIPLMTLIPINSLAIETLKISFQMEVKSSREFTKETSTERKQRSISKGMTDAYKSHEFDTELHGTLSSKGKDSGNSSAGANYEVSLTAGQLPLPKGMTAILDIFTKNLAPLPSKD